MIAGLQRTFVYMAPAELAVQIGSGRALILAATLLTAGMAAWSFVLRYPRWVTICVLAPAAIGCLEWVFPDTVVPHLAAIDALPAVAAGLIGGILARPRNRAQAYAAPYTLAA